MANSNIDRLDFGFLLGPMAEVGQDPYSLSRQSNYALDRQPQKPHSRHPNSMSLTSVLGIASPPKAAFEVSMLHHFM